VEEEISDDDLLYRRLAPQGVEPDGTLNNAIFMKSKPPNEPDPEISVDLARLTTPEKTLAAAPPALGLGLGQLKVGDVRKLGFTVSRAPSKKNPAHCVIIGLKTSDDYDRLTEITTPVIYPKQRQP
jgi:hypothetical protein